MREIAARDIDNALFGALLQFFQANMSAAECSLMQDALFLTETVQVEPALVAKGSALPFVYRYIACKMRAKFAS